MVDADSILPRAVKLIRDGVEAGLHPGAQLCVWRDGQPLVDAAFGDVAADTLMLWQSAGKPLTAVAVAQLVERGELGLDESVAEYVPGFERHGKGGITLRHVLTHTGGFRAVRLRYPEQTWDEAVEAVCDARLETGWILVEDAGYHVHSGWTVLARVVEVVGGLPIGEYVRQRVLEPVGLMDSWLGMPAEVHERYAAAGRLSVMRDTSGYETKTLPYHTAPWATGTRPGGNFFAPARDVARFYQMLLNGGTLDGERVLEPDTVGLFTARHREGRYDRTFRAVVDWGLGFILNSRRHDAENAGPAPYGYGPCADDSTFGHGGNQCAAAFADPAHGLAVALCFNGMPGEPRHQQRVNTILAAVYEDLGLAGAVE